MTQKKILFSQQQKVLIFFMKIHLIIFTLFISCHFFLSGQDDPPTSRRAARGYLSYSNYRTALEEFIKLRDKDSTNIEYNHSIGLCYIETNIDKSKAIPYLEWVVQQPKSNTSALYDLGRAYALNYRFDDAIAMFEKYRKAISRDDNYITADRWIEMCLNAKELIKKPLNVTFQNLGNEINSDAPDMNAFVTADETYLAFTTKRSGNVGGWLDFDGFYTSDIMYSNARLGIWQKARRLPNTINSAIVEESVGMSPDGSHLFLYMDNFVASGDIYLSVKTGRNFNRVEPLGKNLNTRNLETSACIAPNKKIIFLAAAYPDSYGGTDIYYSAKLPNGEWGIPVNAGPVINTPYDEEFPVLAPDGKSFYFSSTGHNSMGGFDIFRTEWNKETMTFSKPENMGYPINTPDNNFTISFTKSGRYAYVSAFRPEGYGDLDIYRVIFHDIPPPLHKITGKIVHPDSTNIFSEHNLFVQEYHKLNVILDTMGIPVTATDTANIEASFPGIFQRIIDLKGMINKKPGVRIMVTESETGKVFGIYRPDVQTGRYVAILPTGNYTFTYQAEGYTTYTTKLILPDYESFNEDISISVVLKKE
jgi:hypothetical protein